MSLITGSPAGTTTSQEDLYFEGAPTIYFQDYNAPEWYSPDSEGFYWNLTGTSTYNVYEVGCVLDVSLTENLTMNDVLCDNLGVKDTVQQRNYVEFVFTIQSFFGFDVLTHLMKFGTLVESTVNHTQKLPIGKINNNRRYHVWAPKVYDEDVGDYVGLMLHKAKFVDAWTVNMTFGNNWKLTGLKLRAFHDSTKPAAQSIGMLLRSDADAIV